MKKLTSTTIAFMSLLTFITSSCYIDLDDDPGLGPVVKGSGYVITEERLLSDFDRIVVEGSANVIISQGEEQMVQIEADDNIVPIIETRVRGGELTIDPSRRYRTKQEVNIYITTPAISSLRISGSGNIYGETPITGDVLELAISGSGNMDLEIDYTRLASEINGSGDVLLFGEVNDQEVHISGSGDYHAKELLSQDCYIKISGSGFGEVNVSDRLDAEIRGSGDVVYFGNPQVSSSIRGSGHLIKGR